METQPPRKPSSVDMRTIATLVLAGMTVILAALALVLPWWVLSTQTAAGYTIGTDNYYLTQFCVGAPCQPYSSSPEPLQDVFRTTAALVIVAVPFAMATLVLAVVGQLWPRALVAAIASASTAAVTMLAAAAYLFFSLPGATGFNQEGVRLVTGFYGSYTSSSPHGVFVYGWGGGSGWYLALVAGIVLLVVAVACFRSWRRVRSPVRPQVPGP